MGLDIKNVGNGLRAPAGPEETHHESKPVTSGLSMDDGGLEYCMATWREPRCGILRTVAAGRIPAPSRGIDRHLVMAVPEAAIRNNHYEQRTANYLSNVQRTACDSERVIVEPTNGPSLKLSSVFDSSTLHLPRSGEVPSLVPSSSLISRNDLSSSGSTISSALESDESMRSSPRVLIVGRMGTVTGSGLRVLTGSRLLHRMCRWFNLMTRQEFPYRCKGFERRQMPPVRLIHPLGVETAHAHRDALLLGKRRLGMSDHEPTRHDALDQEVFHWRRRRVLEFKLQRGDTSGQ